MKNFNWLTFVRDCRVYLASPRNVSHLVYGGIEIHPLSGTSHIGAYTFERETSRDKQLIQFFENHGLQLSAIGRAIQEGLCSPEYIKEVAPKPFYHVEPKVLQAAFEKGKELRKEIEEAQNNPRIFFM